MPTLQVQPRDNTKSSAIGRMLRNDVLPMALITKTEGTKKIKADREAVRNLIHGIEGLTIFDLEVEGDKKVKVILKDVQRDPVSRQVIHLSVLEIAESDVIKVKIPVHIQGTPEAVAKKVSTLMVPMSELEVKAKVSDLPNEILVDVSKMDFNDRIVIDDLQDYSGITFMTSGDTVLATTKQLRGMADADTLNEGEEGEGEVEAGASEEGSAESSEESSE